MRHLIIFSSLLVLAACHTHIMELGAPPPRAPNQEQDQPQPDEPDGYINPWVETADDATSTFSADVDTGSYSLARRTINEGSLPMPGDVRVEEFVNYFHYDDAVPTDDLPFSVSLEAAPSRFGPAATDKEAPTTVGDAEDIHLLRIGIQAEQIEESDRDPVNLVFLLDVSCSMSSPDKLDLVKYSMKHLVDRLSPEDTLGIVVYAGSDGVVLQPTAVEDKSSILDALDALESRGSTNGEAGIRTAYELAESAFRQDGVNRVVLCTDGDMNVGLTGPALVQLVQSFRDRGIFLTTLGFGVGNYDDGLMEQLADNGNGNYAYIDSRNEALRVLGENLVGTLQVVAKDVKIQVEFDASVVERWRLIGYENRLLEDDEFDDDEVDAGDIGAGHSVTALYEIDLTSTKEANAGDLAEVRLRYKEPTADDSTEHTWSIAASERLSSFDAASDSLRFGAAVTEFAEILRHSPHSSGSSFDEIIEISSDAAPTETRSPSKQEFIDLVAAARDL